MNSIKNKLKKYPNSLKIWLINTEIQKNKIFKIKFGKSKKEPKKTILDL